MKKVVAPKLVTARKLAYSDVAFRRASSPSFHLSVADVCRACLCADAAVVRLCSSSVDGVRESEPSPV